VTWILSFRQGHRATKPGTYGWTRLSSRLLFSEAELLGHLFAHDELLHLASDGHRKGVDELDVARDLVVGDLLLAKLLDLRRRRGNTRFELDPRTQLLAVFRIGYATTCPYRKSNPDVLMVLCDVINATDLRH
jgi:hypothetical protein